MSEDTKFWLTLAATIIIGPAMQAFLQFLFQARFARYVEKEVAKLKKEMEEKEKQNEKRIKAAEELIDSYRELFSNSQVLIKRNLNSLDESIKDNLKNIEKLLIII